MTVTAGALSQVSVSATQAVLVSAAATAGSGPYTYQWYRSTTSGFTPGGGNILAGKTSLSLTDTGLTPGTQYYYVVKATDTGDSNATDDSAELAVATALEVPSQNQFAMSTYLGMVDLRFNANSFAVQVDASETGTIYAGQAVKIVDSAGGVPKVIACDADDDEVLGFVNYNIKDAGYVAGDAMEISAAGNCIYLRATGAIARGARVTLDVTTKGGVASITSGDTIVGWAFDKASAAADLIRVMLTCPSFTVAD